LNVLVVDDDAISQRLIATYLSRWGYTVTTASDGAAAWELFEENEYEIVITDWMMPNVDGLELIRRIRASERGAYVYALLLTARTDTGDIVRGMEIGADDFIGKPFDRDELRVRVREGERVIGLEVALAESRLHVANLLERGEAIADAVEGLRRCVELLRASPGETSVLEQIEAQIEGLARLAAAPE
jgi:two-component system NtrC family sensor kinase